jgi:uncharacterized membrane protein YfcA
VLEITLPVLDQPVDIVALVALGVAVGFVSAFFGVGGGVLAVPMLNVVFGVPYHFAVGTSPAVIFGTAISGTLGHRRAQQLDVKLGAFMVVGVLIGVELGAGIVEVLKRTGEIHVAGHPIQAADFVLPLVYACLLVLIAVQFYRESVRRKRELRADPEAPFVAPLSRAVPNALWRPRISLPASGIEQVSIWIILLVGLAGGFVAGLLGIGGGVIFVPVFIYLFGMPTAVAVGTSVFVIIFASGIATFSHATKGNCDIVLAVFLLFGSTVGAQLGAWVTRKLRGVHIRYAFAYLAGATAVLVVVKVLFKVGVL